MGWSFRKSKSIGPFRLNFSKSGVGVSTGVKGARMSFGPRGTYVNLGRNGIYYRKKIGGGKAKKNKNTKRISAVKTPQSQNAYMQPQLAETYDAIKVSDRASNTELGNEIVKDIKRSRIVFWLWLIASAFLIYYLKEWGIAIMCIAAILLWKFFFARLEFDLDDEAELEWDKLTEIIYGMRNSKKIWLVESASYNLNTKKNAGASRNISRGEANVKLIKPNKNTGFRIRTDVSTTIIRSNKCKVLFIPSGILIKKGAKTVSYTYDEIDLISSTVNFIESGSVARDAEIIRQTWQFVNKNGTPDGRYKNNRQLPVCLYGSLRMRGSNLDVEIQTSNKIVVQSVGSAYQHYAGYVRRLNTSISDKAQQLIENPISESEPVNDTYRQLRAERMREKALRKKESNNNDDISSTLLTGATLFSGEIETYNSSGDDPYSNLFEMDETPITTHEDNGEQKTNVVDDLMDFFDEE